MSVSNGNGSGSPTNNQVPRQGPFYWGTNAILYDSEDASLIGSLGNPGKVGARVTYYWSDIEPTAGNWQFAVYDSLMKRAGGGQIPLLGILAYAMKRVAGAAADMQGDPWALSFCPPDTLADFATFAGTVVARYPAIQYWEIWNEPNTQNFWRPGPDPARYVDLLKLAYAAVKAANPKAVVVLGGLSPGIGSGQINTMTGTSFLQAVYQSGGQPYFDAVGFHPYNGAASPDSYLTDYVSSLHDVMTQYGDGNKSIWVTEIGWYVGSGSNLSESDQASYLSSAFSILYNLQYVQSVYWYNVRDYSNQPPVNQPPASVCGPGPSGAPVDYGLFRFDGSRRPAADAFKSAVQ